MTQSVLLPPFTPLEYRAIGIVRGRYLPSQKKIVRGTLVTEDGAIIPANLTDNAGWLIKLKPELAETEHVWVAWPRTEENILHLQLKNLRLPVDGQTLNDVSEGVDYFSVRGEIVNQDPHTGAINIRICRNVIPPGKALRKKYQPFILAIEGFLPGKVDGQFWDFDVSREGNKLILEDASFVAQVVFELPPKEEPAKKGKKKGDKAKVKLPPKKLPLSIKSPAPGAEQSPLSPAPGAEQSPLSPAPGTEQSPLSAKPPAEKPPVEKPPLSAKPPAEKPPVTEPIERPPNLFKKKKKL